MRLFRSTLTSLIAVLAAHASCDAAVKTCLAIDGGGVRGAIPARILQEIEERTGLPSHELFDVIAGTSAGGLIAAGVTARKMNSMNTLADDIAPKERAMTPKAFVKFFKEEGGNIFKANWRSSTYSYLKGSKNDPEALEDRLFKVLLGTKLSDSNTRVLITTYKLKEAKPYVFDSKRAKENGKHHDFMMFHVTRATSAAPAYMPAAQVPAGDCDTPESCKNSEISMIDGGVIANNPALLAYQAGLESVSEGKNHANGVFLVSLGTGDIRKSITEDYHKGSALKWVPQLLGQVMMYGASQVTDRFLRHTLTPENYYRLEPKIPEEHYTLDDATHVPALITATEEYIKSEPIHKKLDQIAEELCKHKKCPTGYPRTTESIKQQRKDTHEKKTQEKNDMLKKALDEQMALVKKKETGAHEQTKGDRANLDENPHMNAYMKKLHNNRAKQGLQEKPKHKSPFGEVVSPERKESNPTSKNPNDDLDDLVD